MRYTHKMTYNISMKYSHSNTSTLVLPWHTCTSPWKLCTRYSPTNISTKICQSSVIYRLKLGFKRPAVYINPQLKYTTHGCVILLPQQCLVVLCFLRLVPQTIQKLASLLSPLALFSDPKNLHLQGANLDNAECTWLSVLTRYAHMSSF